MYFSTLPMVTAPWPANSITQLPSHKRSCGANPPAYFGHGRCQAGHFIGFAQPPLRRQPQPIGDMVAQGTMHRTIRHTALRTARALLGGRFGCITVCYLRKILRAQFGRPLVREGLRGGNEFQHWVIGHQANLRLPERLMGPPPHCHAKSCIKVSYTDLSLNISKDPSAPRNEITKKSNISDLFLGQPDQSRHPRANPVPSKWPKSIARHHRHESFHHDQRHDKRHQRSRCDQPHIVDGQFMARTV